jgi:phytoene dehydrogenase-like protein
MTERLEADVAVVGGGLAGLAAATYLGRAGRRVVVFEQAPRVGGRAQTQRNHEFLFNLGPHALYAAGPGARVLRELGVRYQGGTPGPGAFALQGGRLAPLPLGPRALLTSGLLSVGEKLALGPLVVRLVRTDAAALGDAPLGAWLRDAVPQPGLRALVAMLLRTATYAHDPERQSAGAALAQLQLALKANVRYLDGGWQTLVDGLRAAAEAAGVRIVARARVVAVLRDAAVRGVRLADGATWAADAVLVAASPAAARALVSGEPPTELDRWAAAAVPVRLASLDVALRRLPRPGVRAVFGMHRPVYLSVHSAVARLAPEGGATLHAARYLGNETPDPRAVEAELEGLLDLAQPGWREVLVARRFLPHLTVSNALVTAAHGGTAGRPGPAVPDVPGLYVAGDWVGPEGMLADASLASARRAAGLILAATGRRGRAGAPGEGLAAEERLALGA